MFRTRINTRARRVLAPMAIALVALAGCSSDSDDESESAPAPTNETADAVDDGAANGADPDSATAELPADYPIPVPEGGTISTMVIDDAAGTSRVVVVYATEALDGLVQGYDTFFDDVEGDTERVPLTEGLASWLNDTAGYSVVINAQNPDIQVTLQTGV